MRHAVLALGIVAAMLAAGGVARAGSFCHDDEQTAALEAQPSDRSAALPQGSVTISGNTITVVGGPSESVIVHAPADMSVTAVGGDGAPGKPGVSTR